MPRVCFPEKLFFLDLNLLSKRDIQLVDVVVFPDMLIIPRFFTPSLSHQIVENEFSIMPSAIKFATAFAPSLDAKMNESIAYLQVLATFLIMKYIIHWSLLSLIYDDASGHCIPHRRNVADNGNSTH